MASMEDYTDGLRASLNQRMEHALSDNMVKVSDILSKTHAQMVADLTDPTEWYYSDAHRYLIDLLHVSYGGPKRKGIRFQTNPSTSSMDDTHVPKVRNGPKIKGRNSLKHPAVERNTHAQQKNMTSSKEPFFDGTDAMRRYKRQKALERNAKNAHGPGRRNNQELRSETFAENVGRCFMPTHQRPQKVTEKQPTDINELTIFPGTASQEQSSDLTPPQNSEERAPTKQTKTRKVAFPPETQEKGLRHASEVVIYDRWIQPIAGDKSLPEQTTGKTNDRYTRREKSIFIEAHSASKSTQTENEGGKSGGKVKLFSIPLGLSPNSEIHDRKRPHTSTVKLKSSQGSKVTKFSHARSPRNDTNFQSLIDNAKKRLAEIEKELHGLCIESGIIYKSATTSGPEVRGFLASRQADATNNLPGEGVTTPHGKPSPVKTHDISTLTPSEWCISKPLNSSDARTVHFSSPFASNQPNASKSHHSRYHSDVVFTKSALIHPTMLVRPQHKQRWNTRENTFSTHENGGFGTTSDFRDVPPGTVDTPAENTVAIPCAKEMRNSPREEELKMLLTTSSLKPSLKKQIAKSENLS